MLFVVVEELLVDVIPDVLPVDVPEGLPLEWPVPDPVLDVAVQRRLSGVGSGGGRPRRHRRRCLGPRTRPHRLRPAR